MALCACNWLGDDRCGDSLVVAVSRREYNECDEAMFTHRVRAVVFLAAGCSIVYAIAVAGSPLDRRARPAVTATRNVV